MASKRKRPSKKASKNSRSAVVRTRQSRAAIQAERDEYRRLLHEAVLAQYSKEELCHLAKEEDESDCLPLEEFLGELEEIVKRGTTA
jgi:hypothetical protein